MEVRVLEFLKVASVVIVSSVVTSALLAKLMVVMFARRVSPPGQSPEPRREHEPRATE
jgi:hypothetical protein